MVILSALANFILSLLFARLKDLPDILGAISTIVDTLDPTKWLPNDFENLDEGECIRCKPSCDRAIWLFVAYNQICLTKGKVGGIDKGP